MNTAILSTSGTFSGIGFAIPIDTLDIIVTMLIRDGKVKPVNTGIDYLSGAVARLLGERLHYTVYSSLLLTCVYTLYITQAPPQAWWY